MGQVTDQERRDVAKKLRGVAKKLGPQMDAHEFANYTADVLDADENMTWYQMELRLADLIGPPARCPHYMYPCCRTDAGGDYIDRDALLKLADEMDAYTCCPDDDRCGKQMPPLTVHGFARRIREALGAES